MVQEQNRPNPPPLWGRFENKIVQGDILRIDPTTTRIRLKAGLPDQARQLIPIELSIWNASRPKDPIPFDELRLSDIPPDAFTGSIQLTDIFQHGLTGDELMLGALSEGLVKHADIKISVDHSMSAVANLAFYLRIGERYISTRHRPVTEFEGIFVLDQER